MTLLAVDIGGTFTDVVVLDDEGRPTFAKVLTTPDDPVDAFVAGALDALARAGVEPSSVVRVAHATTLATNVILERRGVPVAFVTTKGFRSLLTLGRGTRVGDRRFDLFFEADEVPVPDERCFEVPERMGPGGVVIDALDEPAARDVVEQVAALGVSAVAVCLLHAYANPAHERRLAELFGERGLDVVLSCDVWPELREHDRAATTLMSAYVGPVMAGYLDELGRRLAAVGIDAPVHVMDSAGGVMSAALAARRAVRTIESGPAAGVMAAARHGADVLSFDMGGTTAKAAVVRHGRPDVTYDFRVGDTVSGHRGGLLLKVPSVDLVEVGSGGGSIAWVDAGGALRVGPRSAGAVPGPACYGRGGELPTVTDAAVALGYLDVELAGGIHVDEARALDALRRHVADPLRITVPEAAVAVHDLAVAQMGDAVHIVTVQRGIDPRRFTLVALGGAGPMHAARIAERFSIDRVVVPLGVGVGSAVGLLATDLTTERSRALVGDDLEATLADLERACLDDLEVDGAVVERFVDARYRGQAHDLTVDADPAAGIEDRFIERYAERYGAATRRPVEVVAARVRVRVPVAKPELHAPAVSVDEHEGTAWFPELGGFVPTRIFRGRCAATGPAVLHDPEATIVVPPGWTTALDGGDLVLTRG